VLQNQPFSISGDLDARQGVSHGAGIALQRSTDNAFTWNTVITTTTDNGGHYQFTQTESAAGSYWYRTTFDGTATDASSASPPVMVTAGPATALTATAPASAESSQDFTVTGQLTSGGAGIGNQLITLQRSTDTQTWNIVTTTWTWPSGTVGGYLFTVNEAAPGTVYYRTLYAGAERTSDSIIAKGYAGATSTEVPVTIA
jgi:hypothetical protein